MARQYLSAGKPRDPKTRKHWNFFVNSMLGPAQNPDGSLKEADQIEWRHSASPCPTPLTDLRSRKRSAPKKSSATQKKPSARKKAGLPTHPTRSITAATAAKSDPKRLNLTLYDKLQILDYMESEAAQDGGQAGVIRHFISKFPGLKQSTVSRIKKDGPQLRQRGKDPAQLSFKRPRVVIFPQIETSMSNWILQAQSRNVKITGELIRAKIRRFAELHGVDADNFLQLSNGWLDAFKARHLLKEYRCHGEAASVTQESVAVARKRLQAITSQYAPTDIYNMDETGLYYRMPPDRGLATMQTSGVKGDKTRLTLAFCANADGSDRRPPLFLGHARKPRCFEKKEGKSLGFDYWFNKKAWMTGTIFQGCATFHSLSWCFS